MMTAMMEAAAAVVPGLYVLALATSLHYALARWFDRVPRNVIILQAALIAIVLGPHLFLARTLLPISNLRGASVFTSIEDTSSEDNPLHDDLLVQLLPTMRAVRAAIADGEPPFRDDSTGGGIPLWADQQAQILQPLSLLALPFDAERAITIQAALRMLLALVFSYLFFTRETGSERAGLIGSMIFGLGGFVQLWLGWPIATTAAWLPAGLYAIDRVDRERGRRDTLLLIAATFGLLTSGHPETVAYAVCFGAMFTLWRVTAAERGERLSALRRVAIPLFVGALLSAPMNAPALHAIGESERSLILEYQSAIRLQTGETPSSHYGRVVSLVAPEAFGNNRTGAYVGENNINEDGAGYTGAASLLLIALQPFARVRSRLLWFAIPTLLACVLILAAPPPFGWIGWKAPILSSASSGGHRLLVIVYFLFAWLSAECVRRLRDHRIGTARLVGVALALVVLLVMAYRLTSRSDVEGVDETRRQLALGAQIGSILVAGFALSRRKGLVGTSLLAIAVAGELLVAHLPANPPAKLNLPPAPPTLEFLRARAEGWRVDASVQSLRPNLGSLYGVRTFDAYNPIQPWQWFVLTIGYSDAAVDDIRGDASEWLDALGVRYVLRPMTGQQDGMADVVFSDGRNVVLERSTALSPYRFAGGAAVPDKTSLASILMRPTDVAKTQVVARSASLKKVNGTDADISEWLLSNAPPRGGAWVRDASFWTLDWRPHSDDRLSIVDRSNHRVRLETRTAGPRLVMTTLIDDGGWTARANRRPVAVRRVNGPFVGIEVPAGESEIELRYVPPGLISGSVLGLAGLLLVPIVVVRRGKRA